MSEETEKRCPKCSITKDLGEFYNRARGGYSGYCKKCSAGNSYEKQKCVGIERKLYLIKESGGGCKICGYNQCIASLSFHHHKPKDKKFTLSAQELGNMSWTNIYKEFKKCDLLCMNCHNELHWKENNTDNPEYKPNKHNSFRENTVLRGKRVAKKTNKCECGKLIKTTSKRCKECYLGNPRKPEEDKVKHYCKCGNKVNRVSLNCVTCAGLARRTEKPPVEEIIASIESVGYSKTGKKYNVSDNAIRKWLIGYNLDFKDYKKL